MDVDAGESMIEGVLMTYLSALFTFEIYLEQKSERGEGYRLHTRFIGLSL